jgi:flagellar motility protein MotE (MotC chaperone)
VIEAMWVKDVVDLMWETQCFRRLRTSMLMNAGRQALIRILRTTKDLDTGKPMTPEVAELTAACYLIGDEENVQEVDELLKDYALDLDSIMAQALSDKLDDIERIDRMIAVADARRNKALAELESRRENLARRLRTATDQVIEAPSPNRSR